jgi:hypothetical protein
VRRALVGKTAVVVVALGAVGLAVPSSWARDSSGPHTFGIPRDDSVADPAGGCGVAAPDPVPDGQPIVVSLPPGPGFTVGELPALWWKNPPYGDSGWQLSLRGFMWLPSLARRAYNDGQHESLNALVEQVLAFHSQNPDPGTGTTLSTTQSNGWGWDEGTSLRRLISETCLYGLTKDTRLKAPMLDDIAVQFGPRYYGPPNHPVHNHGTMADRAGLAAGKVLGRADVQNKFAARLMANAPAVFTAAGTSKEQSADYHVFNNLLWGWVADDLQARTGPANPNVTALRSAVARATTVSQWLTQPDGNMAVFGDGFADKGYPAVTRTDKTFRDDTAGLIVGRWSWSDPNTSYYLLRYGPKRWAHGQPERGGVTWATSGVRVLVNPGRAAYDPSGNYAAWTASPSSHNVATPDKGTYTESASAAVTGSSSKGSWSSWTITDKLWGVTHARTTSVLRDTRSLVATDTFPAGAGFHQFWHLDPSWVLASRNTTGTKLTFTSGTHTLTVTTGGTATVLRGSTRPVAGWNFPAANVRVPAVQIQVAAKGTVTTTFAVS